MMRMIYPIDAFRSIVVLLLLIVGTGVASAQTSSSPLVTPFSLTDKRIDWDKQEGEAKGKWIKGERDEKLHCSLSPFSHFPVSPFLPLSLIPYPLSLYPFLRLSLSLLAAGRA